MTTFDAIVVGSGMTGGMAAKELAEQGFKVLVIERGKKITHGPDYKDALTPWTWENFGRIPEEEAARDYPIQSTCYAVNADNKQFWVKDTDHPYSTPEGKPFRWIRGYHLGGRSIMWGRQSYRWSALDFEENKRDGHGVDWPVRYSDIAPWYDRVERFAGISGSIENMPALPDGVFQPAMDMNALEKHFAQKIAENFSDRRMVIGRVANLTQPTDEQMALGRGRCQSRNMCFNGCSFGGYFSAIAATLPAAERTGNLTIVTDAIAHSVVYDPATKRAKGVKVIDANTKAAKTYEGRVVFLCASTIASAQILLNSRSEEFPTGLANRSDQVGRNLMDHFGAGAYAAAPGLLEDRYYWGRRPNGTYIPRYRNIATAEKDFVRGFGYQCGAMRSGGWSSANTTPGVGKEFKESLRKPGGWVVWMGSFGEMLPNPENRVTLHPTLKDRWGIPLVHIDVAYGQNELNMMKTMKADADEMLKAAGYHVIGSGAEPTPPGDKIHEMGTVRMGRDPKTSVLNGFNHAHDVGNLYVTDGAAMASTACQNPSLTYMAFTARAAHHAGDRLKSGAI